MLAAAAGLGIFTIATATNLAGAELQVAQVVVAAEGSLVPLLQAQLILVAAEAVHI
jgi:hypothetical protein